MGNLYNKVEHTSYFHNGSILELASLQYADSVIDYQGAEYDDDTLPLILCLSQRR